MSKEDLKLINPDDLGFEERRTGSRHRIEIPNSDYSRVFILREGRLELATKLLNPAAVGDGASLFEVVRTKDDEVDGCLGFYAVAGTNSLYMAPC